MQTSKQIKTRKEITQIRHGACSSPLGLKNEKKIIFCFVRNDFSAILGTEYQFNWSNLRRTMGMDWILQK